MATTKGLTGPLDFIGFENKFGKTTNADNGVSCDVWDRANATNDQPVWLAPTAPRVHAFVSTSASDTMTATYYGLRRWDSKTHSSGTVDLTGDTPVNTAEDWAIIHRIEALGNVGTITATAASDDTVTAQLTIGKGKTLMGIYGISSKMKVRLFQIYASIVSPAQATAAGISLLFAPDPANNPTSFRTEHEYGIESTGTSHAPHVWIPYKEMTGPGILKITVIADANNTIISGGFDLGILQK